MSASGKSLVAFVVLSFLATGSLAPVAGPFGPSPAVAAGVAPAPTSEDIDLSEVRHRALESVRAAGGARIPPPDRLAGYSSLHEDSQRALWAQWVMAAARERAASPFTSQVMPWNSGFAGAGQEISAGGNGNSTSSKDLAEVWGVELHGGPRAVLPASKDGASFLLTSRAVIRFPSPGAAPSWLAKPAGVIMDAAATDADGDGAFDLVVSVSPDLLGVVEHAMYVIDGKTGKLTPGPIKDRQGLARWSLTDVDGDKKDDVIGLAADGTLVALKLDGGQIYKKLIPGYDPVYAPGELPAAEAYVSYDAVSDMGFVDVSGDGVDDAVVTGAFHSMVDADADEGAVRRSDSLMRVSAFDGKNGNELWAVTLDRGGSYSYPFVEAGGDFDGDKKQDPVVGFFSFGWSSASAALVGAFQSSDATSVSVLSGADGSTLMKEKEEMVDVSMFPVSPPSQRVGALSGEPFAVADLDKDGKSELLVVAENGPGKFNVMGLVPSGRPDGAPTAKYTVPLDLGNAEGAEGEVIVDDFDGDGKLDVTVFLVTVQHVDGQAVFECNLFSITPTAVTGQKLPQVVAAYFFDGVNGQAYGFMPEDDHFAPLGPDGNRTESGLRLLLPYVEGFADVDKDGVDDIVLDKSAGLTVVDGRSGKIIKDLNRPLDSYVMGIYQEGSEPVALESEYFGENISAFGLRDGSKRFRFVVDEDADEWVNGIGDADKDGRLDLMIRKSGGRENPDTVRVVTPRSGRVLWETDTKDKSVRFADVAARRAGLEVLLEYRGETDDARKVTAVDAGAGKELWTFPMAKRSLSSADDGYLVFENEDGTEFSALNGDTGVISGTVAMPEDSDWTGAYVLRLSPDRAAFVTFRSFEQDEQDVYEFTVKGLESAKFDAKIMAEGLSVDLDYGEGFVGMIVWIPWLAGALGDWNGDGTEEVILNSVGRTSAVSLKDGYTIAIGPLGSTSRGSYDVEADGKEEILLSDASSRLSLVRFSAGAEPIPKAQPRIVATPPAEPELAPKNKPINESTPGPGLVLGLVALGLALAWRRRN